MIRRLLRLLVSATIVAGLIGIARQWRESVDVARGRLPRASAAAQLPAGTDYGPVAARLASWVPGRPTTRLGQTAVRIWAAPLTGMGFIIAAAAGAPPVWRPDHGCFLAERARGLSGLALRFVGAQANTIGQVVISTRPDTSPALLAHEVVHVRQAERLGPLFVPLYAFLAARYGYRDHPFERAARLGALHAIGASGAAPQAADAPRSSSDAADHDGSSPRSESTSG